MEPATTPLPSAAANIAAGMKDRAPKTEPAATPVAAVVADVAATAKPTAAPGAATPDEVAALKKRLDEFESRDKATTERRAAEDFTTDFIRSEICKPFPTEMLRKMLPVSADEKVLVGELRKIGTWVEAVIGHEVSRGRLTRTSIGTGDVGGMKRDGGTTPSAQSVMDLHGKANTPYANIANGLRQAQRQNVTSLQQATLND